VDMADTMKMPHGNGISRPFFRCAEAIRVRKYELELRHPNETKVQLGDLATHQGCVVVDAYQFVQGVLEPK
jgi:hypothetical protein